MAERGKDLLVPLVPNAPHHCCSSCSYDKTWRECEGTSVKSIPVLQIQSVRAKGTEEQSTQTAKKGKELLAPLVPNIPHHCCNCCSND